MVFIFLFCVLGANSLVSITSFSFPLDCLSSTAPFCNCSSTCLIFLNLSPVVIVPGAETVLLMGPMFFPKGGNVSALKAVCVVLDLSLVSFEEDVCFSLRQSAQELLLPSRMVLIKDMFLLKQRSLAVGSNDKNKINVVIEMLGWIKYHNQLQSTNNILYVCVS